MEVPLYCIEVFIHSKVYIIFTVPKDLDLPIPKD